MILADGMLGNPSRKLKMKIKPALLILLLVGCTKTITEVEVEIEEVVVIKDSDALNQILNVFYSDPILSADIRGDTVYQFTTYRTFQFNGSKPVPVSVVRGMVVWRDGILVGTSSGIVVNLNLPNDEINELVPDEGFSYLAIWDGVPFPVTGAIYSNFYIVRGLEPTLFFKGGVSLEKALP